MAYATLVQLKGYLGISGTGDDTLLGDLLDRATAAIDAYCRRAFAASTETRYYGLDAVNGQTLLLDGDLLTITTLTNGDSDGTVLASDAYWLLPRNAGPPYHAIRLKSDYDWEQDTDCEISVAGTWGYSETPPDDIVHACIRLAAYYYRQKDAQIFDVTAVPEAGVITVPQGIPADVKIILDRYKALV